VPYNRIRRGDLVEIIMATTPKVREEWNMPCRRTRREIESEKTKA